MNSLKSLFGTRVLELANPDAGTGYMIQGDTGICQGRAPVVRCCDAIVSKLCEQEIVDFRVKREARATSAQACAVDIECALGGQVWTD